MSSSVPLTTGTVAKRLGVRTWQVRRVCEDGRVAERGRLGAYRFWFEEDLPGVRKALVEGGYLRGGKEAQEAVGTA